MEISPLSKETLKEIREGVYPYSEAIPIGDDAEIEVERVQVETARRVQKDTLRQVYELIETIIEDWEGMVSREGGEDEWEAKYHCDTTQLDNLIERTLRELAEQ